MAPCRFDWHQTGSQVIISIYAKNAIPELSYVDANSTTVREATAGGFGSPFLFVFTVLPSRPSAQRARGVRGREAV